jgi:hypothetical protein
MDERHFENEINRLAERFGAQHYKRGFLKLLWADISPLSNEWFTRIVSEFIYCSRQAPLGDEFREKAKEERDREWRKNRQESNSFDAHRSNELTCLSCNNVGVFVHEGTAYKCTCEVGKRRRENYPSFKSTY